MVHIRITHTHLHTYTNHTKVTYKVIHVVTYKYNLQFQSGTTYMYVHTSLKMTSIRKCVHVRICTLYACVLSTCVVPKTNRLVAKAGGLKPASVIPYSVQNP